ncbi:MAG: class I SAM-dependent methyltransferase [Betaproteobacteria bacterium PRO3]|nr:class I SAM-dependent methyltransferase [Betaproteobacteria bacterium PRO3]
MTDRPQADPVARLKAFWNSRYANAGGEFVYGTEPNAFLVAFAGRLAPGGKVLCLADGEGRNSVWLAKRGFDVSAVDVAEGGVAKARALAAREGVRLDASVADVTRFDFGDARYDAIVSIFLHLPAKARRAMHRRALAGLAPGGVFVYEAYGPEQLRYGTGGPPEPELLHPLDDVLADFEGASIEHAFAGVRTVLEGRGHRGDGQVVQVIARR